MLSSNKQAFQMLFLIMDLVVAVNGQGFVFTEFVKLSGVAEVSSNGFFKLTDSRAFQKGQAFYSVPFFFKNSSAATSVAANSFSTTFAFGIVQEKGSPGGQGMAFVLAPSKDLPYAFSAQYLGLFNHTNDGDPSNHVVAIELDTFENPEFNDINNNHVGIDINSLESVQSAPAGYFSDSNGEFRNLSLASGNRMVAWVEYDGSRRQLNVTLAAIETPKPQRPLISLDIDLSPFILDTMYIGFSSANGALTQSHYVLGWSFQMNEKAQPLDISRLPSLPKSAREEEKRVSKGLVIGLSVIAVVFLLVIVLGTVFMLNKRKKPEMLEDWEVEYGPHRFTFKELSTATKGFSDKELLGRGGFGQVYRGTLPSTKGQVAVKRISHESNQGMKEFIAEIATIGRLRHPNLVRLLGYSRRKGELLLVYDFMPNASLDKFIFGKANPTLNWRQRFQIIKDVASGLAYLHEEWMQVIVHRDIKASNVLLDSEFNGRLGDFGLARLSSHGMDPKTTHLAGTLGYIAPELARAGKANTATEVFAFGAFMLEVACGRRPVEPQASSEKVILVDWASECWMNREILKIVDPKLSDYVVEEMELVLKLGLLCSHPTSNARPSMSRVMQHLEGKASLPYNFDANTLVQELKAVYKDGIMPQHSQLKNDSRPTFSITEKFISIGR